MTRIEEIYLEAFLDAAERDPMEALKLCIKHLGSAKFQQSSGYMRYGVETSTAELLAPASVDIPEADGYRE